MKHFFFVVLLLLSLISFSQNEQTNDSIQRVWVGYAGGPANLIHKDHTSSKNSSSSDISISMVRGFHLFKFQYLHTSDYNNGFYLGTKLNKQNEFNLQYGFNHSQKYIAFNFYAGLGLTFGKRTHDYGPVYDPPILYEHNYAYEKFHALQFSSGAEFQFIFARFMGIKMNGFWGLNKEMMNYGLTFGLVFGKLR